MTCVDLLRHDDSRGSAIKRIQVEVSRWPEGTLSLHYRIEGTINGLLIPARAIPERRDGLWRHTCCEAFVMVGDGPAYHEFNLSPSGEWQAYAFKGYRSPVALPDVPTPRIESSHTATDMSLHAKIALKPPTGDMPLRVGLACVIEDRSGVLDYWALRHATRQPDFHMIESFCLLLP
jgi:hypothetical protein